MKPPSKSSRRDPAKSPPSSIGTLSNRRRFLQQTLAVGVAGVGVPGSDAQTSTSRAKPHKSPAGKKDHAKKRPKDLKESMDWDFERFLNEIVEQLRNGKTPKQIDAWIYPKDSKVADRQKVKTEVEGDDPPAKKDHPLGVCLVAPIEWKMDGEVVTGFTIRGRMGRQLTGEPLECDDFSSMEESAAGGTPADQSRRLAERIARANHDQRLVVVRGGSSSSSSSSSSWPSP